MMSGKIKNSSHAADHMANERTFLAWIRTSIGIMAFGFVVEKFALFLRQMAMFLGRSEGQFVTAHSKNVQGYSSIFGSLLIIFGVLICVLAFLKYKKVEKQIEDDAYTPSTLLDAMLALAVLLIGVFIVIYLSNIA